MLSKVSEKTPIPLPQPINGLKIFLTGFMGSGKSYTGKRLAELTGSDFTDLDTYIETKEKMSVPKIFAAHGENYFRKCERKYLRELCAQSAARIIATGGGTPCFFDNTEIMRQNGIVIFLDTDLKIIQTRLQNETDKRPLLQGKDAEELKNFIRQKTEERLPYYRRAHIIFTQKKAETDAATEIFAALERLTGH